jgi:hypothetical protein
MPTCPTCGLFNPPDALRCDCGYRFIDDVITQEPLTGVDKYEAYVEMVRWDDTQRRQQRMNELGAEGWQLTATSSAGIGYTNLHFQRRKQPGRSPTPRQPRTPLQRDVTIGVVIVCSIIGLFLLLMLIGSMSGR